MADNAETPARLKLEKYGLDGSAESAEYRSYALYRSAAVCDYMQYRHYAGFYGLPALKKEDLFKWHMAFFEARCDAALRGSDRAARESFAAGLPEKSSKWTKKELNAMKNYVLRPENAPPEET